MIAGPKMKEAVNGDNNIATIGRKSPRVPVKTNKIPSTVEGNNLLYV